MRRLQKKERQFKGEITALLAMIFVLMLSLVGALVESASIQITRNRKRADMMLALESVFAEYDRELLDEYDLFVRNGCDKSTLEKRLSYYGITNMTHHIENQERLTDHAGAPFREQAIRYIKNWLGMKDDAETTDSAAAADEFADSEKIFREEDSVKTELEGLLEQEENGLPEENNPLSEVQRLKNTDLITLLAEHPEELSDRSLSTGELATERKLESGNWGSSAEEGTADRVFFAAYLTEHFGNITDVKETRALFYEQEYLLGGYPSDRENLESVCRKLLGIRTAANYAYLLTDSAKQAEAEALALTLCALLTVPGIDKVVKHALLLAWAYGESVVDVRALLKGKKVAAVKTNDTWQLRLANLAKLGTSEDVTGEADAPGGMSYQSYLTGLILLENREDLSMRALNLIESHLHIRADQCMTKVKLRSQAVLRRGAKENFTTEYEYQ